MNNFKSTFLYLNLIKNKTTGAPTATTTPGTAVPTATPTQGKFRDQFDIDSISILIFHFNFILNDESLYHVHSRKSVHHYN